MDEVEVGVVVGVEGEEEVGEGVDMNIKVAMEIIKVAMDITRVDMQIIKVWILNTKICPFYYFYLFRCLDMVLVFTCQFLTDNGGYSNRGRGGGRGRGWGYRGKLTLTAYSGFLAILC